MMEIKIDQQITILGILSSLDQSTQKESDWLIYKEWQI